MLSKLDLTPSLWQGAGMKLLRIIRKAPVLLIIFLVACAPIKTATDRDGPPKHAPPLAHVPDATPKKEPPSRYGNLPHYRVLGRRYQVLETSKGYKEVGVASWYGRKFHGRRTSSGEPFNMFAMTAAHRSLPIPSYVRVKNVKNGREIVVKINDRGPFKHNRLIDLSFVAAKKLGIADQGTAKVEIVALSPYQYRTERLAIEAGEKEGILQRVRLGLKF